MGIAELEVSCYSGHTYAEYPRSFVWQGTAYEVAGIEKAWHQPGERCFRIITHNNRLFNLCYNETQHRWSLTELAGSQIC
jgi:hypothetical protein